MTPQPAQRDAAHAEAVAATAAHIRSVLTAFDTVEFGETAPAFTFAAYTGPRKARTDAAE